MDTGKHGKQDLVDRVIAQATRGGPNLVLEQSKR